MGNKQTIFTDEQLDAYQVRLISRQSSQLWRSHWLSLLDSFIHDAFTSPVGKYKGSGGGGYFSKHVDS